MKKADLIARVHRRLAGESKARGEKAFLGFFVEYLRRLNIDYDKKYDFYNLTPYLPQIIGDAFEEFRTSEDEWVMSYRAEFEEDTDSEVPNLMQIGECYSVFRSIEISALGNLFSDIVGDGYLGHKISSYLNAEMTTLQLYIDKFLRVVYRKGLYDLVKDASGGMGGTFGGVELRCFISAGRVMFTFARKVDESEISVTFIAEDGDPNAYSAGVQSVLATLPECMAMIDEVIANWSPDRGEQARMFVSWDSVMLDVVAAT